MLTEIRLGRRPAMGGQRPPVARPPRSATAVPAVCSISSVAGTVAADPRFDVRQHPNFALGQLGDGFGKVGPLGELVDPLAAYAEQVADLVRSDEVKWAILHTLTIVVRLETSERVRRPGGTIAASRVRHWSPRAIGCPGGGRSDRAVRVGSGEPDTVNMRFAFCGFGPTNSI
jgi:hypothetical protein